MSLQNDDVKEALVQIRAAGHWRVRHWELNVLGALALGLFDESDLLEDGDWDVPLDDLRDEDYELDAEQDDPLDEAFGVKTSSGGFRFVKRSKLERLREAPFIEELKAKPNMRLTAVRNRMGAAAAPPPVPKTPESIRLDEVLRLADLRAQQLGYLAQ